MEITYRPAVPGDIPRLKEIFNAHYARKKEDAYFTWQYFDSALPTIAICAEVDGRIEGTLGMQKRELEGGIPVGQLIDLILTPQLRGQGVLAELGERVVAHFSGLRLLCGLPNLNGCKALVKALGWQRLAKLDALVLQVDRKLPREPELGKLLPGAFAHPARLRWTADQRAWRYGRHPDYVYDTVEGSGGNFAVTKVYTDPVTRQRFGDIVDFQAPLSDPPGLADIFTRAVDRLAAQGVENITTWAPPGTLLCEILTLMGFAAAPQERYLIAKVLDPTLGDYSESAAWFIVQADAEIY
jgi:hypothetical protein